MCDKRVLLSSDDGDDGALLRRTESIIVNILHEMTKPHNAAIVTIIEHFYYNIDADRDRESSLQVCTWIAFLLWKRFGRHIAHEASNATESVFYKRETVDGKPTTVSANWIDICFDAWSIMKCEANES